jgi:DNA mismatch repair protein MutH
LLIAYRYPEIVGDYHDYIFKMADLWRFPEKDLVIMRKDWEAIREKIRSGRAGEISEGDSWYLGAATKGGKGSERRAFCLKQGYVSIIVARILGHKEAEEMESLLKNKRALHQGETVESYIKGQFKPYIGKSLDELGRLFKVSSKSKNFAANVTRYILKVSSDRIEEFEKAEITVKSIRIRKTGALDQEMSFPAFRFKDLVKENWDTSEFRQILTRRFFFVIYKQDMAGIFRLFGAMFWSMPEKILEGEVRRAWERAKAGVLKGDLSELPKISDDITAHVRPHGRRGVDVDELPNGTFETKRSFWLNKKYLARIILAEELEREFRNPETTL